MDREPIPTLTGRLDPDYLAEEAIYSDIYGRLRRATIRLIEDKYPAGDGPPGWDAAAIAGLRATAEYHEGRAATIRRACPDADYDAYQRRQPSAVQGAAEGPARGDHPTQGADDEAPPQP